MGSAPKAHPPTARVKRAEGGKSHPLRQFFILQMAMSLRKGWHVNPLYAAAKEISDFMTARKWKFCIIGGLAVMRWGEPRTTLDVDMTLLTGFGDEERFASEFLANFSPRISGALELALHKRVLLLRASNGKDIDISFGALPFEEQVIRRATPFEFASGIRLPTCSAEDLFIMKVFAGRPRDWGDAEGVAIRCGKSLKIKCILSTLRQLCGLKETQEAVERAREILKANR